MLLNEAAIRTGAAAALPFLGRPSCMGLPAAMELGAVSSLSCIGNRIYTGLGEDELYVAVPGKDLESIASEVATIVSANQKLGSYHLGRRQAMAG